MALTAVERRRMHREFDELVGKHTRNYTKPQLDEAFDELDAERVKRESALKTIVDTSTTGRTWTLSRFKRLQRAYWVIRAKDGF
jgi:hypothetical protein